MLVTSTRQEGDDVGDWVRSMSVELFFDIGLLTEDTEPGTMALLRSFACFACAEPVPKPRNLLPTRL